MEIFRTLFGWLPAGIEGILAWLTQLTGSAGLAIILLTIGIRLALYPLTKKQAESMAAMKELQPKLKEIQEKYKDKPQEYQKRVMQLYQEKGVNPLGGCFPLLIQFPFLIALFQVLNNYTFEGADPHFIIWELNQPDPFYILPLLSAATTYVQISMTTADQSQKAMTIIMPIFIGWISINFPSGLVLYWVVSNLFSIVQQYFLMKDTGGAKGGATAK